MNKLTNDQLDQIKEILSENKNETDLMLEQIEEAHKNDDNSNDQLEEGYGQYIGNGVILGDDIDELDEDFSHLENIDSNIDDIVKDNLQSNLHDTYNLSDEEALIFTNLLMRIRAGETVNNVYNKLPKSIQSYINKLADDEKIPFDKRKQFLKVATQTIIEEMISDSEMSILSIDLEKALGELLPSTTELYSETNKEYIENEFPIVAEKIKETDPVKAKNLLDMRQGFIDAYTFEPMYKLLNNSKVIKNMRRYDKIWSRINRSYIEIAGVCKFNLYSLDSIEHSLNKFFDSKLSKRIIVLFVSAYLDGIENTKNEEEYNDIYRNSFANYFQGNIKNLSFNDNLISDFSINIKNNLINLSEQINTIITEKENELSSKKHKKRR